MEKTYYTLYQITNKLNGMIYIGSHKTTNINDGYYGSGKNIKKMIKELGKDSFEKKILTYYDTNEEMLIAEKIMVNREFIERNDTYNLIIGGGCNSADTVLVKNDQGKHFRVHKNDPDYLSGKLITPNKGKMMFKDSNGKYYRLDKNDPIIISENLIPAGKGKTLVFNETNNKIWVSVDNPKFIDGTYKHITKGIARKKESNIRLSETRKKNNLAKGVNNPNYEKTFIYNKNSNEIKTIKKETLNYWLNIGWVIGRPIEKRNNQNGTRWLTNEKLKLNKQIKFDEISTFLNIGWEIGRVFYKKAS